MTKKEKQEAKEIMKLNKTDKLFMTSDGKFFLNENAAQNHAYREHGNRREKVLKVTTVTADMLKEETETKKK